MADDSFFLPGTQLTPEVQRAPVPTQQARDQAQWADQAKAGGFEDVIGAAAEDGVIGNVHHFLNRPADMTPNPEGLPKTAAEFQKEMKDADIPEPYWPIFDKAVNRAHFDHLKTVAWDKVAADSELSRHGVVANIAASVVARPEYIAAGLIGGEVAPLLGNAGRITNALRGGAVAAGENLALDAFNENPTYGAKERAINTAFGFGLGGVFGFRAGEIAKLDKAAAKLHEPGVDTAAAAAKADAGADSMGAARVPGALHELDDVPGRRNESVAELERLDAANATGHITPAYLNARASLSAFFGRSKSNVLKWFGRESMLESVGFNDKNFAQSEPASMMARRNSYILADDFRKQAAAAYHQYADAAGIGKFERMSPSHQSDFYSAVGRAMRGDLKDAPKEVTALFDAVDKTFGSVADLAARSGVDGFADMVKTPRWLPRKMSSEGFRKVFHDLGYSNETILNQVFVPAIRNAWEAAEVKAAAAAGRAVRAVDMDKVTKVAQAWLTRAKEKASGIRSEVGGGMGAYDVETISDRLVASGMTKQEADAIMSEFSRAEAERSLHPHAKHRIDMDESFRADVLNPDTGETHSIGITDFLENDVNKLLHDYTREMSGWSAMAEKLKVRNPAALEKMYEQLQQEAVKAGEDPAKVLRYSRVVVNSVLGRSLNGEVDKTLSRLGRILRDHAYLTTMGQVGYTMLAEIGPTMAYAGFRNTLRAVPEAMRSMKRMRDGTLKDENARELAYVFRYGSDYDALPAYMRADSIHSADAKWASKGLDKLDRGQQYAKRTLSYASGMHPIQDFLMRVATRGMMYRMSGMANAAKLSKAEVERLRAWGINEEMQGKLFARMKGVDADLAEAKFTSWPQDERDALSAFRWRTSRHLVLEGDIGSTIMLQHSELGKILTQFRSFITSSYEAHFLNSFRHWDDWRTWAMWTTSSTFAALGYSARAYLNTIGDDEKRAKMLNPTAIFLNGGVMQSSWSSIVPGVISSVAQLSGYRDPFQYGRSTNLASSFISPDSIPAVSSVKRTFSALPIFAHALRPDQSITKNDMESAMKLVWGSNATFVRNGISAVANQFPDASVNTDTDKLFPEE